jgi:hypothetical protein
MAAADVRPACTLPVRGTGRRQIQARAETARVQDAGHGGAATSRVSSHVQNWERTRYHDRGRQLRWSECRAQARGV